MIGMAVIVFGDCISFKLKILAVTRSVPHPPYNVLSLTTNRTPSTSNIAQLLSPAILLTTSQAESDDLVASEETLIDDVLEMSGSETSTNPNESHIY